MLTRPWNIHAEQLFPLGYGHALWDAQPDLVTNREVLVGDVGVLSKSHFLPLFNVTKPADHPLNQDNMPDDFRQLVLPEDFHISRTDLFTQPIVVSKSITLEREPNAPPDPAIGWRFRSQANDGALVVFEPPGIVDAIDDRARPSITNYMRENLDSWRALAWERTLALADRDVLFVCGTVKTTRWGTAAFRDKHMRGREGRISVDLTRVRFGNEAFRVEHVPRSHVHTGPMGAQEAGANQCLFMHYYKMKRRVYGDTIFNPGSPNDHMFERRFRDEPEYDPVSCLLDYILDNSGATAAAASDMDVAGLFGDQACPERDALPQAINRLSPPIGIDEHGVGTVSVAHAAMH